jgi:hypothetical protein
MAKKKAEHYVNNKEFLKALIEFREVLDKAEKEEKPRPQVPIYIAECYMKIGTHLATKPNFYNYTFREDMIMDGVENCLQYMDNFNPEKYDNPFAYFTQIIFFAFLRRIEKEKKNLYTKYKLTEHTNLFGVTAEDTSDANVDTTMKHNEWSQEFIGDFVETFEKHKRRKKKKRRSVDEFMEPDSE